MAGIKQTKSLSNWLLTRPEEHYPNSALIVHDFGHIDRPKLSFLFTAEFGISYAGADRGSRDMEVIAYDLKSASRPQMSFNLEDVNFDGYRAKVATRLSFGTIKLTFYEDSLNTANDLIWKYIQEVSPLTNLGSKRGENIVTSDENIRNGANTVGALRFADGPLSWLKVHHHYVRENGRKTTTYTCSNPKIESVEYSDLDMTSSEATTISVTFTVEAINVTESQ